VPSGDKSRRSCVCCSELLSGIPLLFGAVDEEGSKARIRCAPTGEMTISKGKKSSVVGSSGDRALSLRAKRKRKGWLSIVSVFSNTRIRS
jgi:hypothetical protein